MTFVDSNIPMVLIGRQHPRREDAARAVAQLVREDESLVSSAEVVQEILHRYHAIRRREFVQPAIRLLVELTEGEIFPVTLSDTLRAGELLVSYPGISSRDAVHLAIMESHGISRILSFDRGFDAATGIERIPDF